MTVRKIWTSVLLLLVLTLSFRDQLSYVHYYLNQDFIAEFLCINKDKPELQCHGKCFLMQSLEDNHEEEPAYPPLNQEERTPVVYLQDDRPQGTYRILTTNQKTDFRTDSLSDRLYDGDIFHPPRLL